MSHMKTFLKSFIDISAIRRLTEYTLQSFITAYLFLGEKI